VGADSVVCSAENIADSSVARRRRMLRLVVLLCLFDEATVLDRAAVSRRSFTIPPENSVCGNMALLPFVAVRG
jgi:hypothetical protein